MLNVHRCQEFDAVLILFRLVKGIGGIVFLPQTNDEISKIDQFFFFAVQRNIAGCVSRGRNHTPGGGQLFIEHERNARYHSKRYLVGSDHSCL